MAGSIFDLSLQAQTNAAIPNVIPKAPDAAALFKFTDIPVSPYTGSTSISVPMFSIGTNGVTVPISIDYHTGGVRLSEESGVVGLGWALSTGGMISRNIMDKDDFDADRYFNSNVPQIEGDMAGSQIYQQYLIGLPSNTQHVELGNFVLDFYCNDLVNFQNGVADYTEALAAGGNTSYDLEPDIFSYNFPGHSGKFIITRDRKVILQKQDNIRVQFENNGNSFTITDEKGNVFYFSDHTFVTPADKLTSPISSWNLTRIVTQLKDTVSYTYYNDLTAAYTKPDITMYQSVFGADESHHMFTGAGNSYGNELLQKIDFRNGQIQFYYSGGRSDLQGGHKLDSVRIFSTRQAGSTYLNGFNFNYSYFSSAGSDSFEVNRLRLDSVSQVSPTVSMPPYSFTYNAPIGSVVAKHDYSIDHWGFHNGIPNTDLIPSVNVFYNPPVNAVAPFPQYYTYTGGNREASFTYMKAFSLASVKYPTGGKTEIEYEANDYDELNSRNGPIYFLNPTTVLVQKSIASGKRGDTTGTLDLARIYPLQQQNATATNLLILVAFRAADINAVPRIRNTAGIIFGFNGQDANISQRVPDSCDGPVCHITIPVTVRGGNTDYTWSIHIDPSVSGSDLVDVRATFQYDTVQLAGEPVGSGNNYSKIAGGLRIKSLTNYSDETTIAKKIVYEYNYNMPLGNGQAGYYSYGKLMSHPSYVRYKSEFEAGDGRTWINLSLSSSSYTPTSSAITGNVVGYSQVTEYTVDPQTGQNTGKITYRYHNESDGVVNTYGWQLPGAVNFSDNLNGQLLSKVEYMNTGSGYVPLDSISYGYHLANKKLYLSPKYEATGHTGNAGSPFCSFGTGVPEVMTCFYPTIISEKVLPDFEANTVYDQSNPALSITTTKSYFYDNPAHFQITRTRSIDSKGNLVVKTEKYPQDYILSGNTTTGNNNLDHLLDRNMISEIIEHRDSLYYQAQAPGYVTGAQLTTYKVVANESMARDKVFTLDLAAPASDFVPFSGNSATQDSRYRQLIVFDKYDSRGNYSQFSPYNSASVTTIWDYLGKYPIAEVKNADSSSVAYTSFEADGVGGWSLAGGTTVSGGVTGTGSYQLSSAISKSGLNTGSSYIVSYWAKNVTANTPFSIAGTVGGYPVKGKSVIIGGVTWTYFEHKVTGQNNIALTGTGIIDELRLCPTGAQMTSYTYSPLIGMTSQCDVNNRITYYGYDGLGRLQVIKDQDGNVIKTIDYHYKGQ
jgi:YD repeat-containing protein